MKQLFAWVAWIVAWALPLAVAAEDLPHARNLQRDGEAAEALKGAVLVVFVGERCSYCKVVLNEVLIPMSRNRNYRSKLVMRRVESQGTTQITDFNGERLSEREFSSFHGVTLVPTVMLFDAKGRLLAKPLVGLTTVDYYGMYLDEAIDKALAKIRGTPEAKP